MLTTQAIFEELEDESNSFQTYKDLLEHVGRIWERHLGVLPVEIGPKDLVELAVMRQWIRQDKEGAIRISVPRRDARKICTADKNRMRNAAAAVCS